MSEREIEDGQTAERYGPAVATALIGVVAPVVTALVLLVVGPNQLTVHRHSAWQPLYFFPSALALLGGILALRHGGRLRRRGVGSHEFLWFGALSFVLAVALLLFGAYALLMSSIGVEDGGWD